MPADSTAAVLIGLVETNLSICFTPIQRSTCNECKLLATGSKGCKIRFEVKFPDIRYQLVQASIISPGDTTLLRKKIVDLVAMGIISEVRGQLP